MSKKYLPFTADSFKNEKVNVVIGDGLEFLKNLNSEFDVLISDSSDPIGMPYIVFNFHFAHFQFNYQCILVYYW